ncbi:MAG: nuclear transport factor 2 family protein [Propionibacteriaceae bacterium]|nr:nuclear transport factor 2 family protein [Propionibacteriaceae bacterium]
MSDVVDRLLKAMNDHDLEGAASLIHPDYRSEQPAHPGRAFLGREQMHANWAAMFAGIPDFRAEIRRSVQDGNVTWSEWIWSGTRTDGVPLAVRGVTLFEIAHDQIVAGTLYMEDVDESDDIAENVRARAGRGPQQRPATA